MEHRRRISLDEAEAQLDWVAESQKATEYELTEWSSEQPPSRGYWEIRYGDTSCVAWFNGRQWEPGWEGFTQWRGLKAPWPEGYSYVLHPDIVDNYPEAPRRRIVCD